MSITWRCVVVLAKGRRMKDSLRLPCRSAQHVLFDVGCELLPNAFWTLTPASMSLQKICMACIKIDATCELQLCSMMICSSTTPPTLQPLLFRSRRSSQHGQFPWPVADRCYSLPVYGVCCVSAGFTTQQQTTLSLISQKLTWSAQIAAYRSMRR